MSTDRDSTRGGKRINPRPRNATNAETTRTSDPELVPFSGQADPVVRVGIVTMQLNVEGLTMAMCSIIEQLMDKHKATAISLQETHSMDVSKFKICGYTLAARTNSSIHGTATFVRNSAEWSDIATSQIDCDVEWAATKIEGTTVVNVYKPPNTTLQRNSIPVFASPCVYAGDFNCHSTT